MAVVFLFIAPYPLFSHWKIPATVHHWKLLETERFLIHYPEGLEETAIRAASMAEDAALRYEKLLDYRLTRQIPVFLYASSQDFAQTNILPFPIDESTGGFTDFYRRRVVLPFQGDYAVLRHVLDHEIVHAFQFDLLEGERLGSYPLWFMEGMAEYLSSGWDQSAENFVRDAVLHNRMPDLLALHTEQVDSGYTYYKAGQAVMLFIAERYGVERVGFLLKSWRSRMSFRDACQAAFRISPEELNAEFGRFIRARYAGATKSLPQGKDARLREATNRFEAGTGFQMHPAASPDGEMFAYMTLDGIYPSIVLRKLPGPGVSVRKQVERRLVLRALRSSDYEELQILTTRLSFTPDGSSIVVAGRRQGLQSILFFNAEDGSLTESYSPPLDLIGFPRVSPDGTAVVFAGQAGPKTDLYLLTRPSGQIRRLTNDAAAETTPSFSPDGSFVYYSTQTDLKSGRRQIFRVHLETGQSQQLTDLPGESDHPELLANGSLAFISSRNGVPNVELLENAREINTPATETKPATRSATGILEISRAGGGLLLTELVEGAYEIRHLPEAKQTDRLPADMLTFDPDWRYPLFGLSRPASFLRIGEKYTPALHLDGTPFLLITAASGPDGSTSAAGIAYFALADDAGDHRFAALTSYNANPVELNLNVEYAFLKHRADFFTGAYRQSGVFSIFNFMDFSLNNLLYNPYFRLLEQQSTGAYAGMEYPLHSFGSLALVFTSGREERVYETARPEERENKDVFQNFHAASVAYTYDNVTYSMYGPLDGHAFYLQYSMPVVFSGRDRSLNVTTGEFRFYHLFEGFSSIAFRAFAAGATGRDADLYPFQIGGFYSLRGYRFLEFEGRYAFLLNLEYRFNFIEYLQFGIPTSWSPGLIRGVFFFDAGSAFDDPRHYQAYMKKNGVTRDLHMSFGAGIHWANFLWFLFPGATMKIEWATPYDTKRSLPLSRWKGNFSVGFNF
jgi:hypothetical protein